MKLRQKFILLIAVLLLFVLGGSFWRVFADLRQEFLKDFTQDLGASGAAFRSAEKQRFRTLATIAGFLEASPSFRNVLRRSDHQTVHQYLIDSIEPTEADIVVVTDAQGTILNRSDQPETRNVPVADNFVVKNALEGEYSEGYWSDGESLFQVVAIPLVDAHDYIDGTLTLGVQIDQAFLTQLARELRVEIAYRGEPTLEPTDPVLFSSPGDFLLRELELTPGKSIILGKSLRPVAQFVRRAQWKLLEIASVALVIALLVSLPLIGRMTNPVELLEQAQAEMKTIFRTNLDGLLFADERGVITTCNPAATVALGFEESDLVGRLLADKLPDQVMEQLDDMAGGTQSATFTRHGQDFKLYRTFVRREASETLGSLVLIHDVTLEREREKLFLQFLGQLEELSGEDAADKLANGVKNLKIWSELKSDRLQLNETSIPLTRLLEGLRERWSQHDRVELPAAGPRGAVWTDPEIFQLVLENLLRFSLQRFVATVHFNIETDGGSFRFAFRGRPVEASEPLEERDLRLTEPWHSELGAHALGLFVSSKLLERHHSRLSFSRTDQGETIAFHLPRSLEGAECS